METTAKLGLKKPGYIDPVDIMDINYNMDILDDKVSEGGIIKQDTEPVGAPVGTLWLDTGSGGLSGELTNSLMPKSGGVLENYSEKLTGLSGLSPIINLNFGNVFTHLLTGDTVYTITNAVNGQAHSFTLMITQTATARTLTFPASVKWQGGEIPDLSTAEMTYVLTFMSVDGGTNWLGMFGGMF